MWSIEFDRITISAFLAFEAGAVLAVIVANIDRVPVLAYSLTRTRSHRKFGKRTRPNATKDKDRLSIFATSWLYKGTRVIPREITTAQAQSLHG